MHLGNWSRLLRYLQRSTQNSFLNPEAPLFQGSLTVPFYKKPVVGFGHSELALHGPFTTVMAMFNFDQVVDRQHTSSMKWERYGPDVLPLWVADMDFMAPPPVLEALHHRVEHGVFGYTLAPASMVEAICERLDRLYSWEVDPEWLCFLPGLVPGLNLACQALAAPNTAVMTFCPIYPPFRSAPVYQGRRRIEVPLHDTRQGWCFDPNDLESAVTADTRLLLFCNPHNPVGRSYTRAELEQIALFCESHDLVLCSDEIHCELLLDPVKHVPVATLSPELADRTVTLMAPSKTFNLPGLYGGYAIIRNPQLRRCFQNAMRGYFHGLNCLFYPACEAAFREGGLWLAELLAYLRGNRDLVESFVRQNLQPIRMHHVEATYLAWLNLADLDLKEPVDTFARAGVGLSDGCEFGAPNFARLNFACPRSVLQIALQRLQASVDSMRDQ